MTLHHQIRNRTASTIRFLRGREPIVMIGLLLVVVGTWGFIELADEVIEGSTGNFDRRAAQMMRDSSDPSKPIGPAWMAQVGRDLTALGGVAVLTLFIAAAVGFLAVCRAYRTMIVLLVSTSTGIAASLVMKHFFARPARMWFRQESLLRRNSA